MQHQEMFEMAYEDESNCHFEEIKIQENTNLAKDRNKTCAEYCVPIK